MENLKFSEAKSLFYNLLRAMFASEIKTEEDAKFVKQLIDYILRVVEDCRVKGLEEKGIPIAYASIWQNIEDGSIFSTRIQAGITHNDDNNIRELVESMREVFYKWGENTFGEVFKLDEEQEISYIGDDDEAD